MVIESDKDEKDSEGIFAEREGRKTRNIKMDKLFLGELNERLEPGDLEGLAASISKVGVLQPLIVRPVGEKFEVIAGGRRFRAAIMANQGQVPCQVKEVNDVDALQISFQENEERKSASPLEYGLLCWKMANRLGDLKEVADRLGRSESWVSTRINAYELYRKAQIQPENKSPSLEVGIVRDSNSIGIVDSNTIMQAVTSRPINRFLAQHEGESEALRTTFVKKLSAAFPKLDPAQKKKLIAEFKRSPSEQIELLTQKIIAEPRGIKISLSFPAEVSAKINRILSKNGAKVEDWVRELVRKEIERLEKEEQEAEVD
jgi:ParB/RepB/Spo0J family partition protein